MSTPVAIVGPTPPAKAIQEAPASGSEAATLLSYIARHELSAPGGLRSQRPFFRLIRKAASDPDLLEQTHRLRDAVILSTLRDRARTSGFTIALTGPRGGEGASLLSLLLGLSLGECENRRVALLDGRFHPERGPILSEILGLSKNSMSLQKGTNGLVAHFNEGFPNVYFLRSTSAERSLKFFSDKRLELFFSDMRQHFDFTVIDLPPLLADTAGVFAVPHTDRIYLVAEAGKTSLPELDRCIRKIRQAGGEPSGVILNKQKTPLWARLFWRDFFF